MTDQTNIERIVMRRILLIRILRLVISTAVLATLTAFAALWGIGKEVWVARIFENAPPNIGDLPNFYLAAFMHTHIVVQVLTLLTFVSLVYLAFETARLIVDVMKPPRS
ncbi:MAG: hypothetical protein NUV60_03220 [Patescibacteria group bacterium]|nr:hypothetical protein [Patescibacteria group bacterium]